ncbi:MAG: hypothetical protein ACN6OC_07200 [Alcaligenes sp.]
MNVQSSSQTNVQDLQPQGFAPGPLGTVGNLRFKPVQGGTAPIRRSLPPKVRDALAELKFRFSRASPEVRAQYGYMTQRHDNSRRIGNMLGLLTARTNDAKARGKIIEELGQLANLTQGNLANLPGAMESLSFYLSELKREDLDALRDGVLGNRTAKAIVIDRISRDLNAQALEVLKQISYAVDQCVAQEVLHGPLVSLCDMMKAPSERGQELAMSLLSLFAEKSMLKIYLQSVSETNLAGMSILFGQDYVDSARRAMHDIVTEREEQQAYAMLIYIRKAVAREIYTRLRQPLESFGNALRQARKTRNQLAASQVLNELGLFVSTVRRTYKLLPIGSAQQVSRLVESSLFLFRDMQNNAHGALNAASLGRLDDATVENLRNAAWYLSQFGLELDEPADPRRRRLF